jgi:hypothetical protein
VCLCALANSHSTQIKTHFVVVLFSPRKTFAKQVLARVCLWVISWVFVWLCVLNVMRVCVGKCVRMCVRLCECLVLSCMYEWPLVISLCGYCAENARNCSRSSRSVR